MKPYYFAKSMNEALQCFRTLENLYPQKKFYYIDRGIKFKPNYMRYRIKEHKTKNNE